MDHSNGKQIDTHTLVRWTRRTFLLYRARAHTHTPIYFSWIIDVDFQWIGSVCWKIQVKYFASVRSMRERCCEKHGERESKKKRGESVSSYKNPLCWTNPLKVKLILFVVNLFNPIKTVLIYYVKCLRAVRLQLEWAKNMHFIRSAVRLRTELVALFTNFTLS